jgi:hypothetical protein
VGTMNFSIPDDVKKAFNETFKDENKSAVVTELMRRAIEERRCRSRGAELLDQMRKLQAMGPTFTDEEIRNARTEGRP